MQHNYYYYYSYACKPQPHSQPNSVLTRPMPLLCASVIPKQQLSQVQASLTQRTDVYTTSTCPARPDLNMMECECVNEADEDYCLSSSYLKRQEELVLHSNALNGDMTSYGDMTAILELMMQAMDFRLSCKVGRGAKTACWKKVANKKLCRSQRCWRI